MKSRVIVAAVFVPLLFIIIFYLPDYVFACAVVLVCTISSYEFHHAVGRKGNDRVSIYSAFAAALIPIGVYFNVNGLVFPAVLLLMMCMLFFEAIKAYGTKRQISLSQIVTTLFGSVLIPFLLSVLIYLRNMHEGRLFLLLPFVSAFATDAGAYFTGVLIGKKKALPLVSPGKTVEGFIGGLVIGTVLMLLFGAVIILTTLYDVRFGALAIYGIIGAAVTELGDLAFSMIKREFQIKDYGKLLPGHGGMLDRFDSMVFTAPAIYLLVNVIPALIID